MATNRNYSQVPANVAPDVPHYVNQALREITADQNEQDEIIDRLNGPALALSVARADAAAAAATADARRAAESAKTAVGPTEAAVALVLRELGYAAAASLANTVGSNLLAGARLTVHGHSYTPVPGYYVPANTGEWSSKIAQWTGMTRVSHGVSGSRMIENVVAAVGGTFGSLAGDRGIKLGARGVLVLQSQMNDALYGPDTEAGRLGFKHAVRAYLAMATSGKRIAADQAVSSGPEFDHYFTTTRSMNGRFRFSRGLPEATPWLEFRNVSSPTGKVHILTLANDGAVSATGLMTVQVNGVDQGIVYKGQGQMQRFTSNVDKEVYDFSPAVITVSVPSTGTHTVRISRQPRTDGGSVWVYVDSLLIPSEDPPLVLVCKDPPIGTYASKAHQDNWTKNAGPLNELLNEAVSEFPNTRLVDLAPGWDPATMAALETDGAKFHPNETGMEHIANRVLAVIRAEAGRRLAPSVGLR